MQGYKYSIDREEPTHSFLLHPFQARRAFSATAFRPTSSDNDSTSHPLYEPIEGVERFENYCPGGYHPIQIGDQFRGRYRVVHKLGHGSYSTTWLAYDNQLKRYAAVTVCTADSKPKKESDILSALASAQHSPIQSAGATMIPSILDSFNIQGPNARISLSGVVHGDLHLGNILLRMPPKLDQLSIEEMYGEHGAPGLEPVVPLNGKALPSGVPSHGIFPIWLGEASDKLSLAESRILLTDFGEAFSPSEEKKYISHTPLRSLFEGFLATEDYITREQARHETFHENGIPKDRELLLTWTDRFEDSVQEPRQKRGMPVFDSRESEAIFSLLQSMLSFRPEDRPTAKQVLRSEWMVKWALPEYCRLEEKTT
ncbi:kinase-like protein [Aspergillus ibericus CBS 121593]|uniref:non-specific serine/threonine protein kinase n=1 Tax=Aspergillus ibericus CBS 121593 TaxID=1448316 RepID=A0A395H9J5_9EURO|nr:kinase-like protein [Aspergillus ibericus CBS 121593]RAL03835.1 kinase-like protein [Aspergillus ibericus CBS 121593]